MNMHETLGSLYPKLPVTAVEAGSVEIAWSKMTVETIAALAWHGLKQKANDANAGATKRGDSTRDMIANVAQVVAKAERNELNVREGRDADPVSRELTALVNAKATEHFRGKKPTPDEFKAYRAKLRALPALVALAEKRAADAAALDIEIEV